MYFGQRMRCALRDQVAEDEMDGAAMSLRAAEPRLETAVSVVQAG
jgi:hypothetical protein